jgi:hypothetical protein
MLDMMFGAVEYGRPVGMPLCRSLGDGLWEVRSKKTQKTPPDDLALARKRQKEVER